MDWAAVLKGNAIDPMTGKKADPQKLFGAIPITQTLKVPEIAKQKITFDPYPIPNPLSAVVSGDQDYSGATEPTGYVGFIYASWLVSPKLESEANGLALVVCLAMDNKFLFPTKMVAPSQKYFLVFPIKIGT